VCNWIAALSLAPELATGSVVADLRRQLAYLERNVEDDVLGNHIVRNARALVLGGVALGEKRLVEQGEALLRRELPEQILEDGGHYERSPVYHLVVLRDLLDLRSACGKDSLAGPIERMRSFAAALMRPDGRPALFNDAPLDLSPVLPLPAPPEGLSVFPETGYAVFRKNGVWLAFDFGPPAPSFLPAHAHADVLSFQLWADGRPLVVDPGTFTYEPGPERNWFRSTRSHSTVELDGRDQFELWSAFRSGPYPRTTLRSEVPLEGEVVLGDIVHRRRLRLDGDSLLVEDELDGAGGVTVRTSLPMGAPLVAEQIGSLDVTSDSGWLSECMLERSPIEVLCAEGRLPVPARFGWRIGLGSSP
jgi:hypothetical protein